MIDISDVHVSLGGQAVLEGVDLRVDHGELVGLVGPNGAGKTTLLRTVNGLLTPDSGHVRIDGDRIDRLGSRATSRRVATVPQDSHLGFTFTVEEIVEMGRTPHRSRLDWTDATEAVADALATTDIDHLRTRPVDEVSGGERQRVLVARALAQDTPVLLLDEPTASLDVNHQVRVFQLIRGLVEDGRTALAAIHDLDLAARYCDRLALLADGCIRRVGTPWDVLDSADLGESFQTTAAVTENPITTTPSVTALPDRPEVDTRVHVAGTGAPAARALSACWRAGINVSAGIVPTDGAVASLAGWLGVSVVTAAPFETPDEAARQAVDRFLDDADAVIRAGSHPDPATEAHIESIDTVIDWPESDIVRDDSDRAAPESDAPPDRPVDAVLAVLSDEVTAHDD